MSVLLLFAVAVAAAVTVAVAVTVVLAVVLAVDVAVAVAFAVNVAVSHSCFYCLSANAATVEASVWFTSARHAAYINIFNCATFQN